MARKYWKVDGQRASRANHLLAVVDGIEKEDYTPVDWKLTEDPEHLEQYEFLGIENEDSENIGKSVVLYSMERVKIW